MRYFCHKIMLLLTLCLSTPFALAQFDWQPESYTLAITGSYAWVDGFTQIPAGGKDNSASFQRPTFKEVGITSDLYANALLRVDWEQWAAYAKYQYLRPSDSKALTKQLVIRNIVLPAGTVLKLNTRYDTLHLGVIGKEWWQYQGITLSPKIEGMMLRFESDPKVAGVDMSNAYRQFNAFTVRFGADFSYPINDKLSIDGEILAAIPKLTNLVMYDINAYLNYEITSHANVSTRLFAGGGFSHIEFKDKQTMPNHMRLTLWPVLSAGVAVTF